MNLYEAVNKASDLMGKLSIMSRYVQRVTQTKTKFFSELHPGKTVSTEEMLIAETAASQLYIIEKEGSLQGYDEWKQRQSKSAINALYVMNPENN